MKTYSDFKAKLKRLAGNFKKTTKDIVEFESGLEERIDAFSKAIEQPPVPDGLKKDLPLSELYTGIGNACVAMCEGWIKGIRTHEKNMKFREGFDDSMLVYVYGKVKSGKSSLGNMIAYGKHDPSPDVTSGGDAEFAVHIDKSEPQTEEERKKRAADIALQERMKNERKFIVDFLEATSCIQHFSLPGFTWVDSPGLHSTTGANGALAAEYLRCSDLVIFTTTSRSACQKDDIDELVSIIRSGKPCLLLITKCDENDMDEDGGYTINMRDGKEIREIREWCIDEVVKAVEAAGLSLDRKRLEENTLTVACRYAEEKADESGWEQSGLTAFITRLQAVAESEGVRSKYRTPLLSLKSNIEAVRVKLKDISAELKRAEQGLSEQRSSIKNALGAQLYECRTHLQQKITPLADRYYGDDKAFAEAALKEAESILHASCEKLAEQIVQSAVDFAGNMKFAPDTVKFTSFKDINQTVTYHSKKKSALGAVLGAVAGGVGGFLVGGPAGAALGAGLGSAGGGKVGDSFSGTNYTTTKVGDNRQEVRRDAVQSIQDEAEKLLHKTCEDVEQKCIAPMSSWFETLRVQVGELESFLNSTEEEINKEIKQ